MAQRFATTCLVLLGGVAAFACMQGAWMPAAGWLGLALLLVAGLRRDVWMRCTDAPLALRILADGTLVIVRRGSTERVTVAVVPFLGSGA